MQSTGSTKEFTKDEKEKNWYNKTSGRRESPWYGNIEQPIKYSKLISNIPPPSSSGAIIDVLIVGGGITGLTTTYLLSKSGKKVAVIEDGFIGSGETSRTTAHITHALDDRYYNLEQKHGLDGARTAANSHTAAINLIESIVNEENIDCNFERLDGFLFLDPSDKTESLHKEFEATQRAGINATEIIDKVPLDSFNPGPCLRFPNQAQFHPLKYLKGLCQSIIKKEGQIFTETHVQEINSDGIITTDGFTLKATNIVIATNAPIVNTTSKIYDKQDAYRTYVIGARIKKDIIPTALYWDTGDQNSGNLVIPYHYARIQKMVNDENYDLLIVGGEDHRVGSHSSDADIERRYSELESWSKEHFPIEGIEYRWSGQVMEPQDSLAFIGRNPGDKNKNVYIATGDSGNGITHGTVAGILLTDLIMDRNNPWTTLYDPSREPRKKSLNTEKEGKSSEENGEGEKEREEKTSYSITSFKHLLAGQGQILDDKKIAAYKNYKGELCTYSAVCPHLGCILAWNNSEKSFDCPCHGSRFSPSGDVINGPANSSLESLEV
jgi:glycine/D-amino acid oxidase-like deaminating enzyme/nitrite reductase/ring-hydroxylating ferredoxin subunit